MLAAPSVTTQEIFSFFIPHSLHTFSQLSAI
jgi:hypothetical protein